MSREWSPRHEAEGWAGQVTRSIELGGFMYEKPVLQRFGPLRGLTLLGTGADGDGGFWGWIDGCNIWAINNCKRS